MTRIFRIIVGQAFQRRLEAAVRELGGSVINAGLADGSTSWAVTAEFAARTRRRGLQDALWRRWPGAQVTVETVR